MKTRHSFRLLSGPGSAPPVHPQSDLPVVSSSAEALLSDDAGPDVEPLRAVSEELQLLSSLHLLPVLRQDEEGICCHRVQRHILWKQQGHDGGEESAHAGNIPGGSTTTV